MAKPRRRDSQPEQTPIKISRPLVDQRTQHGDQLFGAMIEGVLIPDELRCLTRDLSPPVIVLKKLNTTSSNSS